MHAFLTVPSEFEPRNRLFIIPLYSILWYHQFSNVESVMVPITLAVVCSVVAQYVHTQEAEFHSKLLSWVLLPLILQFTRRLDTNTLPKSSTYLTNDHNAQREVSSLACWIVAACTACVSFYKAEWGIVAFYVRLQKRHLCSKSSIVVLTDTLAVNSIILRHSTLSRR